LETSGTGNRACAPLPNRNLPILALAPNRTQTERRKESLFAFLGNKIEKTKHKS
jgi:16S rRNA G966 N2-methylase RsmD